MGATSTTAAASTVATVVPSARLVCAPGVPVTMMRSSSMADGLSSKRRSVPPSAAVTVVVAYPINESGAAPPGPVGCPG